MLVAALGFLTFVTPALGATGLQWKIPPEGRRFHLMTRIHLPDLMWFNAEKSTEVRVSDVMVEVVTLCVPRETFKTGWKLDCKLEDLAIQASPFRADEQEKLLSVLAEYDERLTGKSIDIEFGVNGRVREVDLDAYGNRLARTAAIQENLRLIFARAFSLVDLELPKKGDDKGKGYWKQDNLLAAGFPSSYGVMGSVRIVHTIDKTDGAQVFVSSKGNGILYAGETVMVGGQERPKNTYDFKYEGKAVFDTADGSLVSREYVAKGVPTASSSMGETGGFPYIQAAVMDRLTGESPTLPATGLLQ